MSNSVASLVRISFVTLIMSATASCTMVESVPGAEEVRIISTEQAGQCELLGRANVQVLAEVFFVDRSEASVDKNLAILAKNEAARIGGNAVLALGGIEDGRRSYNIYTCSAP